jgi:hypothetical protein
MERKAMRRLLSVLLMLPALSFAQATFPTTFPEGAVPLTPEALKSRLSGKAFKVKQAVGPEYRVQYDSTNAYVDVGNFNDSGPWRVEGSSACIEFKRAKSGCSEYRLVGEVLYTKRISNGEVVAMIPE